MVTSLNFGSGDQPEELYWREVSSRYKNNYHHLKGYIPTTWSLRKFLKTAESRGITVTWVMSSAYGPRLTEVVVTLTARKRQSLAYFRSGIQYDFTSDDRDDVNWFCDIMFKDAPKPPKPPVDDSTISMEYCYQSAMGPQQFTRAIKAPVWSEITGNYPVRVARELEQVLLSQNPGNLTGNVGVLHGIQGTGKTTFLRALGQAWKKQAKYTYVTDTGRFFENPDYMLQILLDQRSSSREHVIICEDAGKYLIANSEGDVEAALISILNLGDGMLGQGLRLKLLFTTNAEKKTLHPAVVRAGRCFIDMEFTPFGPGEAEEWLLIHGVTPATVTGEVTLAELYDRVRRAEEAKEMIT